MPKEGILFHKDNTYKLNYKYENGFIEAQLYSAQGVQQFYDYTLTNYSKCLEKMIMTKKQFQNYLYSEIYFDDSLEITFENE